VDGHCPRCYSFTGTPFPQAELYFFLVDGFDFDNDWRMLTVRLAGPNGPVAKDPQLWQWVRGAYEAITVFLFPTLPPGTYTVSIILPDGRNASENVLYR
jgi:hypothetical protein